MKRLLIIDMPKLDGEFGKPYPFARHCKALGRSVRAGDLHQANIVIYKTNTHFRCMKNRWGEKSNENELIPNFLLKDYVLKFSEHFTAQELIESLL